MACSLKSCLQIYGLNEVLVTSKTKRVLGFSQKRSDFVRNDPILVSDQKGFIDWNVKATRNFSVRAQASICVSKALRWWNKALKPNMAEISSAQELVDSLLNADDRLVVVNFYSPGCGGCKTLHPKICQLAESNPDAIFLKVNHEELKNMCHSLQIHVLPFFRFYRGAEGRLCSFSCTIATIKKFKDALAKYGSDEYSLGPAKGLDESELMKLASIGELSKRFSLPSTKEERMEDLVMKKLDLCDNFSIENMVELNSNNAILKVLG